MLKRIPMCTNKGFHEECFTNTNLPTLADAQICSQTVGHCCCLSCTISYQSPSIPSIVMFITAIAIDLSNVSLLGPCLGSALINSLKSNYLGILLLSILARCLSHLHWCFLIISAMFSVILNQPASSLARFYPVLPLSSLSYTHNHPNTGISWNHYDHFMLRLFTAYVFDSKNK